MSFGPSAMFSNPQPARLRHSHSPTRGLLRHVRLVLALASLGTITLPATAQTPVPTAAPTAAPTNGPAVTIAGFLEMAPTRGDRWAVRISGTVTLSLRNRTFFLQQEGSGIYVNHSPTEALPLGTQVEVAGYPAFTGYAPTLRSCTVLDRRPGPEVAPLPVPTQELFDGRLHMRLVRIQARLASERPPGAGLWNLKVDDSLALLADWNAVPDREAYFAVKPGSLVELTGVCTVRAKPGDPVDRVHIHLRTPADVRVLGPPPWWTPRRILLALGGTLAALCLSLLWVWTLRRSVQQHTHQLRAQLRRTEALEIRYRHLFESNPNPMWLCDHDAHRILAVNDAALREYGYSRSEFESLDPRDFQPIEPLLSPTLASVPHAHPDPGGANPSPPHPRTFTHRRKDGSVFEAETTSHVLDFEGRPADLVMAVDVTARRQAEVELRRSENRFATIFRTCPDAIVIVRTADERILDVNPAFERLLGIPRAELIRQTTAELGVWVDPAERHASIERIKRDRSIANLERRLRSRNRGEIVVLASAELIEFGGEWCMLSLLRDITDHRNAERERQALELKLQQTQKLESLGLLAGGIAHDFNNILTVVLGNLSLVTSDPALTEDMRGPLHDAENAALRAADLARQMLAYSGKGAFRLQRLRLDVLVEEIRRMLQVSVSKSVRLLSHFEPDTPEVEIDATQLRQVVLNLVINASEAIGNQPGTIDLRTGALHCDRTYLAQTWIDDSLPTGRYALLEVRDSGCGIPPENLDRIFDPFFSTKFTGRGLGLAAVLGIVRSHRGALRVDSTPGQGTTFRILLPEAGPAQEAPPPTPIPPAPWHGEGRVLLVDDEEDNRKVATSILARLGFEVRTATDGLDALEILRTPGEYFHCVLLDLTMPRMGGLETFREMRQSHPDLPVILCSGYSEHDVLDRCADSPPNGFIAKPYTLDGLRGSLRSVLSPEA